MRFAPTPVQTTVGGNFTVSLMLDNGSDVTAAPIQVVFDPKVLKLNDVTAGDLMGKLTKTSIDKAFQDQVRGMVQPGTSALFLMLEKVTPDKAVEAMSKYGGTVLKTSLSKQDEQDLQEALHGTGAAPESG